MLVNDVATFERTRVVYVAEDRTQSDLDGFWETLTEGLKSRWGALKPSRWTCGIRTSPRHGNT